MDINEQNSFAQGARANGIIVPENMVGALAVLSKLGMAAGDGGEVYFNATMELPGIVCPRFTQTVTPDNVLADLSSKEEALAYAASVGVLIAPEAEDTFAILSAAGQRFSYMGDEAKAAIYREAIVALDGVVSPEGFDD